MTDLPPPDAPHESEVVDDTDASDAKRRLIVIVAGLAVLVSAIATFALMTNDDDEPKAKAESTTTQAGSTQSSLLASSTSNPDAATTTSGGPASTAPGSTGPRPTDPITKLPIPVPTTATTATTATTGATGATTTTSNNGTGPTEAQLDAAYLDAFLAECTAIWANATNGLLYDPDDPEDTYTITSCTESADAVFRTNGDTLAEAKASGKEDAIWFASLNTSSGQMCWLDTANDTLLGCWDPENPDVVTTPTTS